MAGAPVYIVHLSSEDALNQVREARDRGVPAFAETCPQYLLLSIEELERPEFRRREIRLHAAAAREAQPAETLGRPEARSLAGGLHRPLPVLFRRSESTRQRRFHQNPQRRAGRREPPAADPSSRRQRGQDLAQPLRRAGFHHARADSSACIRAKASSQPAATPTSSSGTRNAEHTISAATHHMRVDYSMFEGFAVRATRAR